MLRQVLFSGFHLNRKEATVFKVLTLNNISPVGLQRLDPESYDLEADQAEADVILVRSAKMHDMELPQTLKAVGRAGAGVNNIPIAKLSERGVPVFNTPGANANAVKELVVAGMLLSARNLVQSWDYTRKLEQSGDVLNKEVEAAKKQFAGHELPGRTLGVIGLGAIGRQVAKVALDLGMKVIGFDPGLTVSGAWQLPAEIVQAVSDEGRVHAALAEPLLLEGKQAEDVVGQAAELSDAPGRPGPDLGGDEMDDAAAPGFGQSADGEVGRGRVHGDVERRPVAVHPGLDPLVDASVLADLLKAGHAHDGVVAGAFDDGRAGGLHSGPAPGEDGQVGASAPELGDDGRGVVVARGLKRGEEHGARRGVVGVRLGHRRSQGRRPGHVNVSGRPVGVKLVGGVRSRRPGARARGCVRGRWRWRAETRGWAGGRLARSS